MRLRKKILLLRILKAIGLVATAVLSGLLVFSAYGGHVSPEDSTISAVVILAFPFLLGLTVFSGLCWLVLGKWRYAIVVGAALLFSWPTMRVVCPLNVSSHTYTEREDSTKFKVLTFNVENFHLKYSGNDERDMQDALATMNYIIEQDADVVLLQEASLSADYNNLHLPDSCMNAIKAKYPYRDHGYHDQVILSKHPYTPVVDDSIKSGFASPDNPIDSYHFYARAFDVLVPGHKVRFFNLHLHSLSLSESDRESFVQITDMNSQKNTSKIKMASKQIFGKLGIGFRHHAEEGRLLREVIDQSDENVIVCGDFNDVPCSYVYRTIRGNDFNDAWAKCGFGVVNTFNSNRMYFKIDHILYRGDMIATECRRDKAGVSDHYPLVATFVWKR